MPFSDRLPLFPLGIVLYPEEPVPLHIFEPRYREMTRRCLEEDRTFGVVYVTESALAEVGCTARIRRVLNRYDDGRSDIVVIGEERFRIREVHRDRAYLTADVEPYPDHDAGPVDEAARTRVITQHMKLLELAGETIQPQRYEGTPVVSFVVGQNAGLELEQKQKLLEMPSENARIRFLVAHFREMLTRIEQSRRLRHRAQGDGHASGFPEL